MANAPTRIALLIPCALLLLGLRSEPSAALTATSSPTATRVPTRIAPPPACAGDCNGDHFVRVDELIRGVDLALGNSPIEPCPAFDTNGDGLVTLNEVIAAVNAALFGCPEVTPTPEATATAQPTGTPTATPTPAGFRVCGRVAERPGQTGFARGVMVTLNPLGLTAEEYLVEALYCFEDVPPGDYTLSVSNCYCDPPQRCNQFGCWPEETPLTVVDRDVLDFFIPITGFTLTPSTVMTPTGTPTRTEPSTVTPPATASPSPTMTGSLAPVESPTRTPFPSHTSTLTRTGTKTRTPTRTQTGTRTRTASLTPSGTRTPFFTRTATPTRTVTRTPTVTGTHTVTGTRTLSPTRTATRTRTTTRTPFPTRTATVTRTPSRTRTPTGTGTATRTRIFTRTPTGTRTGIDTHTPTPTRTATGTRTPTRAPTFTRTRTTTRTRTATRTSTFTRTATRTRTVTGTRINTPTRTPTRTGTNTGTATRTLTSTSTRTTTGTRTPTRTPTDTRTATWTRTPSATATVTPTFETIGGEITFFGVAKADGRWTPPDDFDWQGTPIYERPLPQGFFLVVEAKPGPSGRPVGSVTFNWNPFDWNVLPDLQIVTSRALGNGSTDVCDIGPLPLPLGGVPAVDPPSFGGSQFASNAINDLSCRFDARGSSGEACTRNEFQEDSFVKPTTTLQFCTEIGVGMEIAFPPGDTRLTVRVRDVIGQPGLPASMIVRVLN